jgi:hypothetical protein
MKLRYTAGLTYDIEQMTADTLAQDCIKYIELNQNIFVLKHDKDIGLVYEQVIPHRLNSKHVHNPVVTSTDQTND